MSAVNFWGAYYESCWDEQNLDKLAANDVAPEEVEAIVCDPVRLDRSRTSGLPFAIGFGTDGRLIGCVYEPIDELIVRPVTAFFLEPK